MIQRIKLEAVEERQLPRWVYAMIKAKEDPNSPEADDGPKRWIAQERARDFYKQRTERLKEMQLASSRISGLEWKNKPKTTFSSEELDRIIPTRRASYVVGKSASILGVTAAAAAVTSVVVLIGMSVCAELKTGGTAAGAWAMFCANPAGYVQHVLNSFDW